MTFREKLMHDCPQNCGPNFAGGCQGCPRDYGYPERRLCSIEGLLSKKLDFQTCAACWDQEMPDPKQDAERTDCYGEDAPRNDSESVDMVNRPPHYTAGGIECIDAIEAALSSQKDPMSAWLTGQVLKYIWRWPLKNGVEDLAKARFYLERLIEREEKA